jgi:hypothetical protein
MGRSYGGRLKPLKEIVWELAAAYLPPNPLEYLPHQPLLLGREILHLHLVDLSRYS